MRPDVKLGVVLAAVIVLVSGSYYLYRDRNEIALPVSNALTDLTGNDSDVSHRPAAKKVTPSTAAKTRAAARRMPSGAVAKRPEPVSAKPRTARGRLPGSQRPFARQRAPKRIPNKQSNADRLAQGIQAQKQVAQAPPKPADVKSPLTVDAGSVKTGTVDRSALTDVSHPPEPRTFPLTAVGSKSPPFQKAVGGNASADENHRVQPGDTLGELAKRYYGSSRYADLLLKANPQIRSARTLRVGSVIKIPARPSDAPLSVKRSQPAKSTALAKGRTYRVQPGDSFYSIARDVLGDASRWKELFSLNNDLVKGDPRRLQAGKVISLPNS